MDDPQGAQEHLVLTERHVAADESDQPLQYLRAVRCFLEPRKRCTMLSLDVAVLLPKLFGHVLRLPRTPAHAERLPATMRAATCRRSSQVCAFSAWRSAASSMRSMAGAKRR